ncbi:outer membrane beta-barrel protein [Polyangium fumosum]|uniref:Porin n=1 Tax=Polyangium fumosum TaxID=889272 RepID=A0A4U1IW12_9BACT|nr:outer membrane beta-barrel protein [Polyangium fumosum]TKC98716.1 porin [Polyangium fumosum]
MQLAGMLPDPRVVLGAAVLLLGSVPAARADEAPPPATFQLGGYAEAFYQWNFERPSNGITHYRGFDNRHNTFTLSNVALSATWDVQRLSGLVTLQVGHTPSTYYLAEPALAGASGTNATGAELWKYVQQAYTGYRFDVGRGLLVQAGLFLSPIGPEAMAVRDNWNFSRSNLFFGLPFYHTGARVTYPLSDAWALTLACYNGWNSVVDNNEEKSLAAQVTYTRPEKLALSFLYFTGVERPRGAPEGRAWRHLVDVHATLHPTNRLSFIAHVNGGTEPNRFGTSAWIAGALYARFRVSDKLFLAARGDAFHERVPESPEGTAAPLFWPVSWVASGTATADFRPHERASFRLEYRHDHAAGDMYFGGDVEGNGVDTPFVPNRPAEDTVTLGATTWF